MRIPKTPVEFDYDLWTTEDGKCMVRVKRTGEVTEVDHEVMKILRREEKQLRRSYGSSTEQEGEESENPADSILSLDALPDDEVNSSSWLADPFNNVEELITQIKERELICILTSKQRDLYFALTRGGISLREYARRKGVSVKAAYDIKVAIQRKFEKIF